MSSSLDPAKEFLKMASMTIDFTHMHLLRFEKEGIENVRIIQIFFEESMPLLEELIFFCDDIVEEVSHQKVLFSAFLLWRAVNLAILHDQKIVINKKIEIVNKDGVQRGDDQTLAVTLVHKRDHTEMITEVLQKKFPNCLFTAKL